MAGKHRDVLKLSGILPVLDGLGRQERCTPWEIWCRLFLRRTFKKSKTMEHIHPGVIETRHCKNAELLELPAEVQGKVPPFA